MTIRERLGRLDGVGWPTSGTETTSARRCMVGAATLGMHFVAADAGRVRAAEDAVDRRPRAARADPAARSRSCDDAAGRGREAPTSSTRTCGRAWARRTSASGGCATSPATASTTSSLARRRRQASSSTACRRTTARRSPRRSLYGPQSAVWDEAENRLHAQKALLALVVRCSRSRTTSRRGRSRSSRSALIAANVLVFVWALRAPDLDRAVNQLRATSRARWRARASRRRRGGRSTVVQLDVHARRTPPHRREHALPLDLRQQRRGRARDACASSSAISSPALAATALQTVVTLARRRRERRERPEPRRERGDRRRARRLLRAAPARAGADALLRSSSSSRDPAIFFLGVWFGFQALERRRSRSTTPAGGRRRRVLRAHRRLRLRRA